ncbi:BMP family ABC transporter substrate-binding protein [Kibdelosporangium philippinense]|uniref:BMP family ABC transporter substrate-binding protein n=1 Tax=Kibdelosporangium philippinense TaxID=211113 RepID=A0ABS8ZJA4_9PSEU|nr:BMP family ABC transporter substrate-binding protein [Kibdelosporangium philippinense]MCE7005907.1 BMP family ABC transporter substrate-binding protein [Kibdelosporangium philippinense]
MRRSRVTTLAAVALTGALALAGCAKDTGGGSTSPAGGGNQAESCKKNPVPAASGTGGATSGTTGPKVDASALKVGLAYDIGGRGDASFNDSAAAGLDKAKTDMGLKETKELTAAPNEPEDAKQSRLRQLAQEGFNPIIAVGFAYAKSVQAVAAQFPNTKFAVVDDDTVTLPNVTGLVFAEEQGSFLVGVAAVYKSKSCRVGFVGGVNVPLIQKFQAGFEQGVKAASNDANVAAEYITPAGDFTGFQDPAKGNVVANGEISRGADVIYQAAGASGKGVFEAAKSKNVLAIGVDSDQYNQKTVENSRDVIITSMLKRVDVAVYDYVRAVAGNTLSTLPKRFDLKADGVGYATSGGKIDDIKAILDAYKQQIIDGKITVSDKPSS